MGRKELGKLAGFGVAKRVTITSRREEDNYATRVILDFDELVRCPSKGRIPVPTKTLNANLPRAGTEIALSRLVFEPVKSRRNTIESALAKHFRYVGAEDFQIRVNGDTIPPLEPDYAYEWPFPAEHPGQLVEQEIQAGNQRRKINYRIRFTEKSLPARQRGVRIYASGRLASASDLLDMQTGMHGFRLTDYIDAVAVADFIDQESTEYIATDRRSLRWDTFFLRGLRQFLSEAMKDAVVNYQRLRDSKAADSVQQDIFTREIIEKARLTKRRQKTAKRLAGELAKMFPEGIQDTEYRRNLEILVSGLGQGTVLEDLAAMAGGELPGFNALSEAVLDLAVRETGELSRFAEGHIDAIDALKKIVRDVNFQDTNRETELQQLFERAPWLINPVFTQLVAANRWVSTTYERLAKHLGIREYASVNDPRRADLVFLVSTSGGSEVMIVELKAANEPLNADHLQQLKDYLRKAEGFLEQHNKENIRVQGLLIGSRNPTSHSASVDLLNWEIHNNQGSSKWQVRDITEVLELAEQAHKELIGIYQQVEEAESQ